MGILRIVMQVESPGYEQTHTFGVVCIILGLIAIVGGIFGIRRRVWGLALAGAICALFPSHPYGRLIWSPALGILAIVFVALSKGEFLSSNNKSSSNHNGITSVGAVVVPAKLGKAIWTIVIGLLVTVIGFGIELTPLGLIGLLVLLLGIVCYVMSKDR
jgi:hypothetical protein